MGLDAVPQTLQNRRSWLMTLVVCCHSSGPVLFIDAQSAPLPQKQTAATPTSKRMKINTYSQETVQN
jgi:hypothetical protein